jgi:Leucine-rich repeat (LRR) protein
MDSDWEFDLLDFSQRNLFVFPILPATSTSVDLSGNNFRTIGLLPVKIQYLDLSHNNIKNNSNKVFPKGLRTLNIAGNKFKEIPTLPKNVKSLDISYNNIATINYNSLPKQLKYLNVAGNKIDSLKFNLLPRGLQRIDIRDTRLSVLFVPRNWVKRVITSNDTRIISNILEYRRYATEASCILYGLITERGILKIIADYM